MQTAKLFWSGNSQAVRLPKEFRFAGHEVRIQRRGRQVILEPVETDWAWLDELGEPDPSLESAIQVLRDEPEQERNWDVFR
ncbi:MAG: type II toxin-antitoxin system VapB family antitoxin [Lautropia sp.]|nr:type II toxin-antitoxin system VapB family antitoxin [Lautropia sp.]